MKKTSLTFIIMSLLLSFSAFASEGRRIEIANVKTSLNSLFDELEQARDEETAFELRIQIRNEFVRLDELILANLAE